MTPVLGIVASSNQQGRTTAVGSYDALATVTVPSGGLATISFAGIPSNYRHLQLRILARSTAAVNSDNIILKYNGSSSNYYAYHQLYGTGGAVFANTSNVSTYNQTGYFPGTNIASSIFGPTIIDILDYAATNKNKVARTLTGYNSNTDGIILLRSGLWVNTSAITSIELTAAGSFAQYSQFALYGVK
jgi:hypothetical protein